MIDEFFIMKIGYGNNNCIPTLAFVFCRRKRSDMKGERVVDPPGGRRSGATPGRGRQGQSTKRRESERYLYVVYMHH